MRIIHKYAEVTLGIVLIVAGVSWLYTVHHNLPMCATFLIIAGLICISECEEKDAS